MRPVSITMVVRKISTSIVWMGEETRRNSSAIKIGVVISL